MAENSNIEWTHHTFNPWRGCTKVSPGCANCYAETLSKRNPKTLGIWGNDGTRVIAAESYWRQPIKWNEAAKRAGERHRVFCASLADVFEDRPELDDPRARLFDLVLATPQLDWLLLTKRPHVMADYLLKEASNNLPHHWGDGWPNVWLGVSVEDVAARKRIPILLTIPAKVHFLSVEPLIENIDVGDWCYEHHTQSNKRWPYGPVNWIIIGCESGAHRRPMPLSWARDIIDERGGAKVFVKQLQINGRVSHDMTEWPADLRVREFPNLHQP